jgi:hypothetical protein
MDYNSRKFKKALCGLVQECTGIADKMGEICDGVEFSQLYALGKAGAQQREGAQVVAPSTRQAANDFVNLIEKQSEAIEDFKKTHGIQDAEGPQGWGGLVVALSFCLSAVDPGPGLQDQEHTNRALLDLVSKVKFDDNGALTRDSATQLLINAVKLRLSFRTSPIVKILYPTDKMNAVTYGRSAEDYEKTLKINVAKSGSDKAINVTYAVNFEALDASVSRSLSHFDKQVCIALAAHYAAGNNVVSLSQIYTAMGNTGRPSQKQIAKIGESVDKLAKTEITIDNTEEAIAYKGRKKVVDKEMIIACKRRDAYINGHLTVGAIFLYDLPAPIRFAQDRRQIITLDPKVLQSPMNKTEENLILQDYLIRRISRKGDPRRILISTLLSKLGVQGTKQKKWRTLEKVKALLEYYKEIGFIADFKIEPDAICIEQPVKKRIPAASR